MNMNILKLIVNFFKNLFTIQKEDKTTNEKREVQIITPIQKAEKIQTTLIGENREITEGDNYSFKLILQEIESAKRIPGKKISIKINDTVYDKVTDENGVCSLEIHLMPNTWTIESSFYGDDAYNSCSIQNTLVVKKKQNNNNSIVQKSENKTISSNFKPNEKGEYWNQRYLSNGEEKQSTNYYCAEVSIMQCFYELFGIDLSQRHIAEIAGTTTDGTGHRGINRALEILQKEHNVKLSYSWKNFSQVGWDKLAQYCRDPNTSFIVHGGWAELGTWNFEAGHYYTLACVCPKNKYVYEIYSLQGASLQKRSFDYIKASINYISQPSICIIQKK